MMDRSLSPITERSSFSSRRSAPLSPTLHPHRNHPTPIREISYDSEREVDPDEMEAADEASIYSQISSGDTARPITTFDDSTPISDTIRSPLARPDLFHYPVESASPSPNPTPRASQPSTPMSMSFNDIPQPGGLLPPPRKRDSGGSYPNGISTPPAQVTDTFEVKHRRRRSQVDQYPGGRAVIDLDADTDNEIADDVRSIATATTAGLAGRGAGDQMAAEAIGKVKADEMQIALKGIMEEQDAQMRRFRESAPTPTSSRPSSFFHDSDHPTLHNIPTFVPELDASLSKQSPTTRTRTISKLVKSPPGSRPGSRMGSMRVDKLAEASEGKAEKTDGVGVELIQGSKDMVSALKNGKVERRKELSPHDALDLAPPTASAIPPNSSAPIATSPTSSILRTQIPLSTRKRTSRLIPHVLFSLFSDTSTSDRKRESSALSAEITDMKLDGETQTVRRSSKPKVKPQRTGSKDSRKRNSGLEVPISDGLPLREGVERNYQPDPLEATIRKSGTFGVRDDGSDIYYPTNEEVERLSPKSPTAALRRWSSSTPANVEVRHVPIGQSIDIPASPESYIRPKERTGSFKTDITAHTVDTLGTARTFRHDRDRGLFVQDAMSSTDELPILDQNGGLLPIAETSSIGHTSGSTTSQILPTGHRESIPSPPQLDSPFTPDVDMRTPQLEAPVSPNSPVLVQYIGDLSPFGHVLEISDPDDRSGMASAGSHEDDQKSRAESTEVASANIRKLPATPFPPSRPNSYLEVPPRPASRQRQQPHEAPRRSTSSPPTPISVLNGAPPLPSTLSPAHLAQVPTAGLPLLIASHLLSSHATSLMRHSTEAKDMGEEMFRLAQESLDWGKVLMRMASTGQNQERPQGPQQEEGGSRDRVRTASRSSRYDGMPGPVMEEDAYTRLPNGRSSPQLSHPAIPPHLAQSSQYPHHLNSHLYRSLHLHPPPTGPLPTPLPQNGSAGLDDSTLARARRADRQRKAESLPPEWFQRVEHLGSSGWDKIHQAEEVWREGMRGEASLYRAGSFSGNTSVNIGRPVRSGVEDYQTLRPLDATPTTSGSGYAASTASRRQGSRKLVKKPSVRGSALRAMSRLCGQEEVGEGWGGSTIKAPKGKPVSKLGGTGVNVGTIKGFGAGLLSDTRDEREGSGTLKETRKSRWWHRK